MKIRKKLLPLGGILCLLIGSFPAGVQASSGGRDAQTAGYTYTVTIYAGNQGTFTDQVNLQVDHSKSGNTQKSQVEVGKGCITVSGLKKDDIIALELQKDSLQLKEENRYYVKGIRQSGRDNSMAATSVFRVDRDADYVTAYGVKGDMAAYTVNYQDASGNELLPSDKYYGNIGDKPVVAYKYVEGYEPEVTALTRTLTANEAENVFTFIYRQADRGVTIRETGTPGTTTNTITEILPGTAPVVQPPQADLETGDNEAGGETPETGDTAQQEPGEGTENGGEEQQPLQQIGDGEVPLADQDLKDLDEEEVPTANIQVDKVFKKGLPLAACIAIATAAAAALAVLFIVVKKHRNRKGAAGN